MMKKNFDAVEREYTLEDLPRLKEDNDYLIDTVMDMIETGVHGGSYDKSVLEDEDFINGYLLEELNSGFIKVECRLDRNSYEYKVKRLRSEIESNRSRLEDVFDFITINHGEGNFDFIEYSFEYDDIAITNPFMDETSIRNVHPIDYYGSKFVNSKMAKMILDYCSWIN